MGASNHPGLAIPKGPTRKTLKRRRRTQKVANIQRVRADVVERDFSCRISTLLVRFGFLVPYEAEDLAHLRARGMGGNPDLSRDTAANTILARQSLHTGARSLHSGHVKVRALTEQGADGPLCVEFYEKLPSELG